MAWNRKKNRILELEAYVQQLVEGRAAAIEVACDEVRAVAYHQYGDAASKVLFLQEAVNEQERVIDAHNAATDFVTGMTDPATRAAIEKAGVDYRTWRAEHGLVTCRVKGVAS